MTPAVWQGWVWRDGAGLYRWTVRGPGRQRTATRGCTEDGAREGLRQALDRATDGRGGGGVDVLALEAVAREALSIGEELLPACAGAQQTPEWCLLARAVRRLGDQAREALGQEAERWFADQADAARGPAAGVR